MDNLKEAKALAYMHVFLSHSWASVRVFTAFVYVCDLARLCVCVFLHVRAYVSVCVGLLCGGFLAVEWPRDVRVGASSQHPVLQEEVPGVSQVCGAALPPRC